MNDLVGELWKQLYITDMALRNPVTIPPTSVCLALEAQQQEIIRTLRAAGESPDAGPGTVPQFVPVDPEVWANALNAEQAREADKRDAFDAGVQMLAGRLIVAVESGRLPESARDWLYEVLETT